MLSSDELQKMTEKAEQRAIEARRVKYVNEHVPKPLLPQGFYLWWFIVYTVIIILLASIGILSAIGILPGYLFSISQDIIMALLMLSLIISFKRNRYKGKVRKANAEFDELLKKEKLQFHITGW